MASASVLASDAVAPDADSTALDADGPDQSGTPDATLQGTSAGTVADFDPTTAWKQSAKIGLRPEPFGALAYHFDTRRLVFLKSPALVELVTGLAEHDSADAAIAAIIEPATERSRAAHVTALTALAEAGVIEPCAPGTGAPSEPAARPPISFVG